MTAGYVPIFVLPNIPLTSAIGCDLAALALTSDAGVFALRMPPALKLHRVAVRWRRYAYAQSPALYLGHAGTLPLKIRNSFEGCDEHLVKGCMCRKAATPRGSVTAFPAAGLAGGHGDSPKRLASARGGDRAARLVTHRRRRELVAGDRERGCT
ncbi:MAG: hypothetical protein JWR80_412 [Bradyrhizobium sp.]|nr:hypothetical protein [Bradyrhizobium sp.]